MSSFEDNIVDNSEANRSGVMNMGIKMRAINPFNKELSQHSKPDFIMPPSKANNNNDAFLED